MRKREKEDEKRHTQRKREGERKITKRDTQTERMKRDKREKR